MNPEPVNAAVVGQQNNDSLSSTGSNDEGVLSDVDTDDNMDVDEEIGSGKLVGSVSEKALQTLNELRCGNLLCDAVISVSDGSFNVHRAIMSACSPYFRYDVLENRIEYFIELGKGLVLYPYTTYRC